MARIAGVDIPKAKKIGTALTYIYGIGPTSAAKILEEARVSPDLRTSTLGEDQVARTTGRLDGAEGVGRATTEAVVYSSITILISNFFLTLLLGRMFHIL